MATKDNRYQFQPWYIKTYRWLRWKPWYMVLATGQILGWLCTGAKMPDMDWPSTRLEMIGTIWSVWSGMADIKMKHCWTLDEVRRDLGL